MYYSNVVDKCLEALRQSKKNPSQLERLTREHKEIVHAVVSHLDDIAADHSYERMKTLRESLKSKNHQNDRGDGFESVGRSDSFLAGWADGLAEQNPNGHCCSQDQEQDDENKSESEGAGEEAVTAESLAFYTKEEVARGSSDVGASNQEALNWLHKLATCENREKLYKICTESEVDQLRVLHDQFPNLSGALAQIIGAATLSANNSAPFQFPALLIDGPPGVGKTYLVSQVAMALDLPLIKINMASLSGRFELVGGHRTYKDAEPGILFRELYNSAVANPIVLFDEAECGDSNLYQPLYHFVEGQLFRDHFLNLSFRVDAANYVFLTNESVLLPEALRSRLTEFEVAAPNSDQMAEIIQRIYLDVLSSSDLFAGFPDALSMQCIDELQTSSLRVAKNRIRAALFASAASGKTNELHLEELRQTRTSAAQQSIGFF